MNIFGSVLTYAAPSSNYRGESAENRSVIQKISFGRFDYAIISPEAIRNAIREAIQQMGLPCNRKRLHDEEQLAVKFEDYPDADKYADDFFMGWLVAASPSERKKIRTEIEKNKSRDANRFTFKRDSILRTNMAVSLEPYRYDTVFTQSPLNVNSPWKNADSSQLLLRETLRTAYQYPFALNLNDCMEKKEWSKKLLEVIGELNDVAGNHARSYFEFAPASITVRLTKQLVAGYDTYGFKIEDKTGKHLMPEVIDGILAGDYPGNEFYIGGKIVKDMDEKTVENLKEKKVNLDRSPQNLLKTVADASFN